MTPRRRFFPLSFPPGQSCQSVRSRTRPFDWRRALGQSGVTARMAYRPPGRAERASGWRHMRRPTATSAIRPIDLTSLKAPAISYSLRRWNEDHSPWRAGGTLNARQTVGHPRTDGDANAHLKGTHSLAMGRASASPKLIAQGKSPAAHRARSRRGRDPMLRTEFRVVGSRQPHPGPAGRRPRAAKRPFFPPGIFPHLNGRYVLSVSRTSERPTRSKSASESPIGSSNEPPAFLGIAADLLVEPMAQP